MVYGISFLRSLTTADGEAPHLTAEARSFLARAYVAFKGASLQGYAALDLAARSIYEVLTQVFHFTPANVIRVFRVLFGLSAVVWGIKGVAAAVALFVSALYGAYAWFNWVRTDSPSRQSYFDFVSGFHRAASWFGQTTGNGPLPPRSVARSWNLMRTSPPPTRQSLLRQFGSAATRPTITTAVPLLAFTGAALLLVPPHSLTSRTLNPSTLISHLASRLNLVSPPPIRTPPMLSPTRNLSPNLLALSTATKNGLAALVPPVMSSTPQPLVFLIGCALFSLVFKTVNHASSALTMATLVSLALILITSSLLASITPLASLTDDAILAFSEQQIVTTSRSVLAITPACRMWLLSTASFTAPFRAACWYVESRRLAGTTGIWTRPAALLTSRELYFAVNESVVMLQWTATFLAALSPIMSFATSTSWNPIPIALFVLQTWSTFRST